MGVSLAFVWPVVSELDPIVKGWPASPSDSPLPCFVSNRVTISFIRVRSGSWLWTLAFPVCLHTHEHIQNQRCTRAPRVPARFILDPSSDAWNQWETLDALTYVHLWSVKLAWREIFHLCFCECVKHNTTQGKDDLFTAQKSPSYATVVV